MAHVRQQMNVVPFPNVKALEYVLNYECESVSCVNAEMYVSAICLQMWLWLIYGWASTAYCVAVSPLSWGSLPHFVSAYNKDRLQHACFELQEQCSAFILNFGCRWIVAFSVTAPELTHSKSLKIYKREGFFFSTQPPTKAISANLRKGKINVWINVSVLRH